MAHDPDDQGPWKRHGPRGPGPQISRLRVVIWLAILAVLGLILWELHRQFPGTGHDDWSTGWTIRLVAILVIISSGVLFMRRFNVRETVRNLAIWSAITGVLLLGYTFRYSFGDVAAQIHSELVPGAPVQTGPHELILTADNGGNFFVYGEVNGTRIRFVVDTGASDIVLSPADARRAGIDMNQLTFDRVYETANGMGRGAAVVLDHLVIGPISERNVRASVNGTPMSASLLGLAFLKSLKSFEVSRDRLVLHW